MPSFDPVGSAPVTSIGGTGPVGTYFSPSPAVIFLSGQAAGPVLGLKISKTNLAIESHPLSGVVISKTNFAVESDPGSTVSTSKASISIIW